MLNSRIRGLFLPLFLCLGLVTSVVHSIPVLAQSDAAQFADALAERDAAPPDVGPFAGDLVQDATLVALRPAGVSLADFSASASFTNPVDTSVPWDFGFTFHTTAETSQRVYIDSTGAWTYYQYPEALVDSGFTAGFDAAPGATNTLDLFVLGTSAAFGLNGEYIATVTLPEANASDVQIATGFLDSTTVPDRAISFDNFAVWQSQGTTSGTSTESGSNVFRITVTPEPSTETTETPVAPLETSTPVVPLETPTPEVPLPTSTPATGEAGTESAVDAEAFPLLLESQAEATVLAGPLNANVKEVLNQYNESWAGVNVDTFQASAMFDVPVDASGTPWNIGFTFRSSPAGPMRISIDSLGNWYLVVGNATPAQTGTVAGLLTTAGETNQLDLFVAEQRAVLGLNGQFAAVIELPVDTTAGDIAVSTGAFSEQAVAGRITPFHDFLVLDFNPNVPMAQAEPATLSDADITEFAEYVEDTQSVAPLVGPFAGRLVDGATGSVAQAFAGVSLTDFGAVATFVNPDDVETMTWDGGIQFRSDAVGVHRMVVRSSGDVFVVLPDGSTTIVGFSSAYDPTPGARNEFQLFVSGDRALFGVNGELAASVFLPNPAVASDVIVGTPFFGEDAAAGRITSYEGFSVWDMA